MERSYEDYPAAIQYAGEPGSSLDCQDAVVRLIQYGDMIRSARILTCEHRHCLLLTIGEVDLIAVKSGFASGYEGTGAETLSYVLQLLDAHGVEISEGDVPEEVFERLDNSALTHSDIEAIQSAEPIHPSRWFGYVSQEDWQKQREGTQWSEFRPVIPFAVVDPRIADIALSFREAPDHSLLDAYRRLEDIVRKRTGIDQHGHNLFAKAFLSANSPLTWPGSDDSEKIGKANLFVGAYMAFRNPRAHRQMKGYAHRQLAEFLLLNHLFTMEAQSRKRRRSRSRSQASGRKPS